MYTYHMVFVGMALSGNGDEDGFLPKLVGKLDEIIGDGLIPYDDILDILDENNIDVDVEELEFIRWMCDNERHLYVESHYHGSSDAVPFSLEFVPNERGIDIHQDAVDNFTWSPEMMKRYHRDAQAFDAFCSKTMPEELYNLVSHKIGISFLNVSS